MTAAPSSWSIADALTALRRDHARLLDDLGGGDRVLWVGSGVSQGQVPKVAELIRKVLVFLRDRSGTGVPGDAHRQTLDRIVATYLPGELSQLRADPFSWAPPSDLDALVPSYSEILGEDVSGQAMDYLVWDGVDVRETYGAPSIAPGPEHGLLAVLILEGVVDNIVTTNWDGLIEAAVSEAAPGSSSPILAVLMSNDSFRTARGSCLLLKAHGCAVLAREDSSYRQYLVAQTTDIALWSSNEIFSSLAERAGSLLRTRRSLVLGLSVRDANLLAHFAVASQRQPWPWDPSHPAVVFSEPQLGTTQRNVLKTMYRDEYAGHQQDIALGSIAGMYSGPLLGAVALHVVMEKLRNGVEYAVSFAGSTGVLNGLRAGVSFVEGSIAADSGADIARLLTALRDGLSSLVRRYYEPLRPRGALEYVPIHREAIGSSDDQIRHLHIPELAVVIGLLGLGCQKGLWGVWVCDTMGPAQGVIELAPTSHAGRKPIKIVITRDSIATSDLKGTSLWVDDPDELLVIQATGSRPAPMSRGFHGGIGSGRSATRNRQEAWLADLVPASGDLDGLLAAFRTEVSR